MDETAEDDGAIFEAVGFLNHFSDLIDGRQAGKVVYPLEEVLLLAMLAVLAGAETLHRHRPLRRQKAGPAAAVPPVQGWHAAA